MPNARSYVSADVPALAMMRTWVGINSKIHRNFFFEEPETSLRTSTNVTIKQNEKQPLPPMICHFEVLMLTPIVKRKVLIKEIFGFIKNHNSYAFVKFFTSK